jgi:hypothetical protein
MLKNYKNNKQSVWIKVIQYKKNISRKLIFIHEPVYVIRKRQLVTGELSNAVDITRIGTMRVVAGRIAVSYGCSASF